METTPYTEALEAATIHSDLVVTPVTTGLINQTYKVIIKINGEKFLLQQINDKVFSEPEKVQANYENIWLHLSEMASSGAVPDPVTVPRPLDFLDNSRLFCDSRNRYWRMFEFMDGADTFYTATTIIQAKTVAQTFGRITASFESFDPARLHITIPGFHDLSLRFRQFGETLHSRDYERLQKAGLIVNQLKKRERYVSFYDVITESEEFKLRVMHHDAKISNILFDEETGEVICPVDLDTCMPGYFFSDPGDMIRSMACTEGENSVNFSEINIHRDFYEAITSGYLDVMNELLTDSEKKYIHYSGLLVIYMQALRFLSDFLRGDVYYQTTYPDQNFDRAKNQLILLEKLEEMLSDHYNFRND